MGDNYVLKSDWSILVDRKIGLLIATNYSLKLVDLVLWDATLNWNNKVQMKAKRGQLHL